MFLCCLTTSYTRGYLIKGVSLFCMKLFLIKKQIKAKNFKEAIQKEKKAEITDVWIEEKELKEPREGSSVIGFQYFEEYDEE